MTKTVEHAKIARDIYDRAKQQLSLTAPTCEELKEKIESHFGAILYPVENEGNKRKRFRLCGTTGVTIVEVLLTNFDEDGWMIGGWSWCPDVKGTTKPDEPVVSCPGCKIAAEVLSNVLNHTSNQLQTILEQITQKNEE